MDTAALASKCLRSFCHISITVSHSATDYINKLEIWLLDYNWIIGGHNVALRMGSEPQISFTGSWKLFFDLAANILQYILKSRPPFLHTDLTGAWLLGSKCPSDWAHSLGAVTWLLLSEAEQRSIANLNLPCSLQPLMYLAQIQICFCDFFFYSI